MTVGMSAVVLPCLLSVLSHTYPLPLQEQALLMVGDGLIQDSYKSRFFNFQGSMEVL